MSCHAGLGISLGRRWAFLEALFAAVSTGVVAAVT
jgi:hypothetical protein